MCELMGVCVDRKVSAEISINAFGQRGVENADGWGLAWYPDRSIALVKEPLPWGASPYTRFLESYNRVRSHIYVAHVRHRTTGGMPTHRDTHPFTREWRGREFCFAHNGTLAKHADALRLGRFQPVGETDSEHLFCWLLEALSKDDNRLESPDEWHGVEQLLRRANEFGRLNCLLTDGQKLLAYRDMLRWKGLSFTTIQQTEAKADRHLEDSTVHVVLEAAPASQSVVIATRPLNEQPWQAIEPGTLLMAENGQVATHQRVSAS